MSPVTGSRFGRRLAWAGGLLLFASSCGEGSLDPTPIQPATVTLTATVTGEGTLVSAPAGLALVAGNSAASATLASATFIEGATVSLSATPAEGWQVQGWGGACAATGASTSCQVDIHGHTTVSVTFEPIPPTTFTLTATRTGEGTLVSAPAGLALGPGNSATLASATFTDGTTVSLSATPADGWQVQGWGGACVAAATGAVCEVTVNGDMGVSITFEPIPPAIFTLSATKAGDGSLLSTPAGLDLGAAVTSADAPFTEGTTVSLSATPAAGWQVQGWGGACAAAGTGSACEVTVNGDMSVSVTFEPIPPPVSLNLWVEGVHLNQGSQNTAGSIGSVAGRPGVLRVQIGANEPNTHAPDLLVRLFHAGVLVRESVIPSPSSGVPMVPDLLDPGQTWNVALSASEIVPGLSVEVILDPEGLIDVVTRSDNRLPETPGSHPLPVSSLAPLPLVFVPIVATVHGTTGNVNTGNGEGYLVDALRWFPVSGIEWSVRAPITTDFDLSDRGNWSPLLADLRALQVADRGTGLYDEGVYYHGIVGDFPGIALGGIALLPQSPTAVERAAISYDRQPSARGIVAHELGHNLGRRHAPCGNPTQLDGEFPYGDGGIGTLGYDIVDGTFRNPGGLSDFMGYCSPRWISDYNYGILLDWRKLDPWAGEAASLTPPLSQSPSPGLLIWGHLGEAGVVLNPAVSLRAPPSLPARPGPHDVRALDASGMELFRFAFEGEEVSHADDPLERHFAFFVPLSPEDLESVRRIEVTSPFGQADQSAYGSPPGSPPTAAPPAPPGGLPGAQPGAEVLQSILPDGRVRITWDRDTFPLAVMQDQFTGQITGILRNGEASLSATPAELATLQILLSDGVRSWPARRLP